MIYKFGSNNNVKKDLSPPCDHDYGQEPSDIEVVIWVDARMTTYALSVVSKPGFGKRMRHLEVAYLWLQEDPLSHRLDIKGILGTGNPSNICTKHVHRSSLLKQFFETSL